MTSVSITSTSISHDERLPSKRPRKADDQDDSTTQLLFSQDEIEVSLNVPNNVRNSPEVQSSSLPDELSDAISFELTDPQTELDKWNQLPVPSKYICHLQSYLTVDEIKTLVPLWTKLVSNTTASKVVALFNTLGNMQVEESHYTLALQYEGTPQALLHTSKDNRTERVIITPFTIFRVSQENPGIFMPLKVDDNGNALFRLYDSKNKIVCDGFKFIGSTEEFQRDLRDLTKNWLVVSTETSFYRDVTYALRIKFSLLGAKSIDHKTTQILNTPTAQKKLSENFFGTFDVSRTPSSRFVNAIATQKFNQLCKFVYVSPKEILNFGEYIFIYFCFRCSINQHASTLFSDWSMQINQNIAAEVYR